MRTESLLALRNSRDEQPHRLGLAPDALTRPRSPHTPHTRAAGLMVFDHKGRLVLADARAVLIMAGLGVELNGGGRLRIDALDAGTDKMLGGSALPDWLHPDWIEPVIEGGERLGTVVQIPEAQRRTASAKGGLPAYQLRQVVEFIHAHIDEPINLTQLAGLASLSPFHFHRAFKRSTGLTPGKYIFEVRIKRAEALLSESDLPLAQLALQVGFGDQSHFSAAFRRATSMTPGAFRRVTAKARSPQGKFTVAQVEERRAA